VSEIPPAHGPSPQAVRQEHIGRERTIRGIAALYFSCSVIFALTGLIPLTMFFAPTGQTRPRVPVLAMALCLGIAALFFAVGYGLRHLKPWGRVAAIVFAFVQLCGVPIGTVLGIWILYLLTSKGGKLIFSPGYKEVIAQTPTVKYRTPVVLWILLGVVMAGLLGLIGYVGIELWQADRLSKG
jgi:hypothetical protein